MGKMMTERRLMGGRITAEMLDDGGSLLMYEDRLGKD